MAMTQLAGKRCVPCQKGTPPLSESEIRQFRASLPEWELQEGKLSRNLKLRNFAEALGLVNRIGRIAESEGHHPDLYLHSWNQLRMDLYTHAIRGLSENDFILAAKIDELMAGQSG